RLQSLRGMRRMMKRKVGGALAVAAGAVGGLAFFGLSIGALAVGAVAIGRIVAGDVRVKRLRVDALEVGEKLSHYPDVGWRISSDSSGGSATIGATVTPTEGSLAW